VKASLGGTPKQIGSTKTHKNIWRQNPDIFALEPGSAPNIRNVRLNVSGVLNMFVRRPVSSGATQTYPQQQQQQQLAPLQPPGLQRQQQATDSAMQQVLQHKLQSQQQQVPGSAMQQVLQHKLHQHQQQPAAVSGPISAAALLQYVRSRVWHSSTMLHSVRLVLAERLVIKVNGAKAASADQQPAITDPKWYTMLGSMTGGWSDTATCQRLRRVEHLNKTTGCLATRHRNHLCLHLEHFMKHAGLT
jgi:hypothetical protein